MAVAFGRKRIGKEAHQFGKCQRKVIRKPLGNLVNRLVVGLLRRPDGMRMDVVNRGIYTTQSVERHGQFLEAYLRLHDARAAVVRLYSSAHGV